MFADFEKFFNISSQNGAFLENPRKALINLYGGGVYGGGVFSVLSERDVETWRKTITDFYQDFRNRITPFAFDWLGRCFAEDSMDKNHVLMFEIGTANVLIIPADILTFLNSEIPNNSEACLALGAYHSWLSQRNPPVTYGQCVGYKIPLFLGGKDAFENMELSSLDVYWNIMGQVMLQTR